LKVVFSLNIILNRICCTIFRCMWQSGMRHAKPWHPLR